MENLNIALLLMIVGMATVFAILLIVIYLGKGLIALVNKYAPEEVVPACQTGDKCSCGCSRQHHGGYQCGGYGSDARQG